MTIGRGVELAVARALAFFNTVALTWLGLTVLLNADRNKLGTWLTGGGLLLGGLCSIGARHRSGPR